MAAHLCYLCYAAMLTLEDKIAIVEKFTQSRSGTAFSSKAYFTNGFIRLQFKEFNKRVIGKHFDRSWPAQSPNLTPVDFFLGTTLKRKYRPEISPSNQYHHNQLLQLSGICVLFPKKYGRRFELCVEKKGKKADVFINGHQL